MKKQAAAAERKKIMFQPYSAILGRFLSEKTEHTVSMAMPLILMVKTEFGASLSSITILPGTFANRSEENCVLLENSSGDRWVITAQYIENCGRITEL